MKILTFRSVSVVLTRDSYVWSVFLLLSMLLCTAPKIHAQSPIPAEVCAREVFGDQIQSLYLENPVRKALVDNFLSRCQIIRQAELHGKDFRLMSAVPLQTKHNSTLRRDVEPNPLTFNPLKYALPMSSKAREIFRFDGTDWLLVINPVRP